MAKFRKKPVVIEAMRLTAEPDQFWKVYDWIGNDNIHAWDDSPFQIEISTLEGVMVAREGDWIIKGVAGEFYPCKPDIFAATYEAVAG